MQKSWLNEYPAHIAKEIDLSNAKSIFEQIEKTCKKYGPEVAITCMGTDLSFKDLLKSIEHLSSFFQHELGLKKGDRIAIMLPNIIQFPIAFLAAQKCGLIVIGTNPLYTPREMAHQFKDSGAETIVILDVFLDKLEQIINDTKIRNIVACKIGDQLPILKSVLVSTIMAIKGLPPSHNLDVIPFKDAISKGSKRPPQNVEVGHDDIALLQYTGGTTGVAKGAMLTQKNILANMYQINEWVNDVNLEENETVLTALPLYHIFAMTVNFLTFLRLGHRMILVPKPVPIENTVKMFKKYRITLMTGVNTLFNSLNHSKTFQLLGPFHLKAAVAGGMALQSSVKQEFQKITGIAPTEGYGLTEASPVTHVNLFLSARENHGIGYPLPSTEAKIVDDNFNELPIGEVGELAVKGPQVMKGYWQRDDETAKVIKDGWLKTGDMAKVSDKGYFEIVDRKKDMINVSGFNVYPNEVEDVICSHEKVVECGVIGINDGTGTEVIKAFVVASDKSLTQEELKAHCKENLTNYKRPKLFVFRDELPKSNVGKIIRRELRDH